MTRRRVLDCRFARTRKAVRHFATSFLSFLRAWAQQRESQDQGPCRPWTAVERSQSANVIRALGIISAKSMAERRKTRNPSIAETNPLFSIQVKRPDIQIHSERSGHSCGRYGTGPQNGLSAATGVHPQLMILRSTLRK
ncbi:hypothetical protein CYLTODRAFT_160092 [Cylindrobasidium torrendii FP15055 ss-10]|uniref:Uncharacterized protein n=1 Tax=Cylindrobasidium torrendii FP15055 ss-10 TaxID=1314674 RepID=A0A0D7AXE8_9AGAR|nr:hypothetical protein CYLTODRAFT_160092 [Cylindrobasidium torrendii FP15055 ss-10]